MQKITPFLWYAKEAEEAAAFYAATFPDSRVVRVTTLQSDRRAGRRARSRSSSSCCSGSRSPR